MQAKDGRLQRVATARRPHGGLDSTLAGPLLRSRGQQHEVSYHSHKSDEPGRQRDVDKDRWNYIEEGQPRRLGEHERRCGIHAQGKNH